MIQYILGRKELNFKTAVDPNTPVMDSVFANERLDSGEFRNLVVNHCTFANMGFRKAKFTQNDFRHCIFIDCYFKNAWFEDVNFTACKFINCEFGSTTIIECDFRYAQFEECYIQYKILGANLPMEFNLRRELARNLAMECLQSGDTEEYRKYFFEEREASERHYWEMFLKRHEFYRKKYGFWDGLVGLSKFITNKISKRLWGYGESIRPLLVIMGSMILVCSIFFWRSTRAFVRNVVISHLSFSQSIFYSFSNFFGITIGTTPISPPVQVISSIENVSGIILTGFLVAALFRYINRR